MTRFIAALACTCLLAGAAYAQDAPFCSYDHSQQSAQQQMLSGACTGGVIDPHGSIRGAVIFSCPDGMDPALPDWYNYITSLPGFYSGASNNNHNLTLDLITDGDQFFQSDYPLQGYNDNGVPNDEFVWNVLEKSDPSINWADYDHDGDGYVDFLLFITINDEGVPVQGTIDKLFWNIATEFETDDDWPGHPGQKIKICNLPSLICNIPISRPQDLRLVTAHEYGHLFGWPDMDHNASGWFDHYSLGGFEVMTNSAGFKLRTEQLNRDARPSPPNPWFRESVGWHSPTPVTADMLNEELKDLTDFNQSYLYTPASIPGSAEENQRWYVARHTNGSGLYSKWEIDPLVGGVLVYHIDNDGFPTLGDAPKFMDYRKMPIDLEVASGKYTSFGSKANALIGRDSLDSRGRYPYLLAGSNGAFFRPEADMEFAFYKNPNSNLRYASEDPPYEYAQGVTSGFALKNITKNGNDMHADILVNDYNVTTDGVLYDGRWEVYGTITVKSGNTLTIEDNADVYMQAACDLIIEDNATVICNGVLNMQQRNIEFLGPNAEMIVQQRTGLQGVAEIKNGNIVFVNGYDLPAGQTVNFTDGCQFRCLDGVQTSIDVYGTMQFSGAGFVDGYAFSDCFDNINVYDGGMIYIPQGGVMLENVPNVVGFANSQIITQGNDQPPGVVLWKFRDDAELNIYGWLDADWTWFRGTDLAGTQEEWSGIAVIYPESKIEMDHCKIENVHASAAAGNAGIHMWESGNPENHVVNCDIIRENKPDKYGYGIFMQYAGHPSFLNVSCTDMLNKWWTGIAVVGSELIMETSKMNDNRIGANYMWGTQASMHNNCIERNEDLGVIVNDAQLWLMPLNLNRGYNRIAENENVQIEMTANAQLFGGFTYGQTQYEGYNNISHTNRYVKRITLDQASAALAETNWWGLAPEWWDFLGCHYNQQTLNDFFTIAGGSTLDIEPMLCDEILPYCGIACREGGGEGDGGETFESEMFSSSAPQSASSFTDLFAFAEAGNYTEVYRFTNDLIQNNPAGLELAASMLLRVEQKTARLSSAHKSASAGRILPWLHNQMNAQRSGAQNAAILRLITEAYFLHGDEGNAERYANSLRTQYPGTRYAAQVLPYLQLMAMNQRDSVKMNAAIANMVAEGASANELMLARSMKRVYHRIIPKAQLPKQGTYGDRWRESSETPKLTEALFNLRNYPNPFNPSTVIEYTLPEEMEITLMVYSIIGKEIKVVESGLRGAGMHRVEFTAPSQLPSGLYIYELRTPHGTVQGRMVLAK